jgi:hypothetical protein
MSHTDSELKDATQVAYIDWGAAASKLGGRLGEFTIGQLIDYAEPFPDGSENCIQNLRDSANWDEKVQNWKIIVEYDTNDQNGFYGCLIQTSDNEAIVGFRGSEGMDTYNSFNNDWLDSDVHLLLDWETKQQLQAEQCMRSFDKLGYFQNYDNLSVTGHSLGGNLAEHVTITGAETQNGYFSKIGRCVSFDGPSFSDDYIIDHRGGISRASGVMTHFQFSIIGALLQRLPGVTYKTLASDPSQVHGLKLTSDIPMPDFLKQHSTNSIGFDENGNAKYGEIDPLSAFLGYFTRGVDHLPSFVGTGIIMGIEMIAALVYFGPSLIFDEDGNLSGLVKGALGGLIGLVATHPQMLPFAPAAAIALIGTTITVLGAAVAFVAVTTAAEFIFEEVLVPVCNMLLDAVVDFGNWAASQIKTWITNKIAEFKQLQDDLWNGLVAFARAVSLLTTSPYANGIRDFSQASFDRLLALVRESGANLCVFTDFIEDSVAGICNALGILHLFTNADSYQLRLFDMNNTSEQQLKTVFDNVYAIDSRYSRVFSDITNDMSEVCAELQKLSGQISKV